MRLSRRDKQRMYYSLFSGSTIEYELDENGDIIYDEIDGEEVPRELGIKSETFATPVKFYSSISSQLNEMHVKAFGVDSSSIYCKLCVEKGYVPRLTIGTLIWRINEIEWQDTAHTIPKASSADYTVVGLMRESLTEDFYLLKCNSSED